MADDGFASPRGPHMSALLSLQEVESRGLIQDASFRNLYDTIVLTAEKMAINTGNETQLLCSRVVGYFLLYPPSDDALVTIKSEIESCSNDPDPIKSLYSLGEMYLKYLSPSGRLSCYLTEQNRTEPSFLHSPNSESTRSYSS